MIKRFGSLFAGHIDLDDMGQDATPANDRRYDNDRLATVFAKTEAMAVAMDGLGYDAFWLAEHHFQHEGYECIPNLPLFFVHLAAKTERLRFGCGFNVTTMWHPLRLAEDFATADILTGGRVIFGVGRGYHTREVETLGGVLIDGDANRDMFEEQVEIVLRSFHEESFRHDGRYYTLPPRVPYRGYELDEITLVPRPVNQPVECWQPIVSAQPRGLDFMAKHGIKGIVGGGSALMAERPIVAFKEAWERAGHDVRDRREPLHRPELPYRRDEGKGDPGGHALLRGACQDVRAARHGADEARAVAEGERTRRLGRDEHPDAGARRRGRLLVLRPAGGLHRLSGVAAGQVSGAGGRQCPVEHGHAALGDARAARTLRQGGDGALPRAADRQAPETAQPVSASTAPEANSASISLASAPASASTSALCSPSSGVGRAADGAVSRKPI